MVDIYNQEEPELKTMMDDGEQNNEEYSARITTVFYDEVQHEIPIRSKFSKWLLSITPKKNILYSVGLLVFIISISTVALASYHGRNRGNNEILNKQGYTDDQYYKSGSKGDVGYFNIYIRIPTSYGNERRIDRLRFPAARYSRHQLPLNGRAINYRLPTPIRVHESTRQTIIYSSEKAFLLPPLFNYFDDIFSIGELIASGYACFVNNGDCLTDYVDVTTLFYPQRLTGHDVPKLNSRGDGFIGGVDTYYRSSFPSKLRQRPLYEFINSKQSNRYDYGKSYRPRNPYYKRPVSMSSRCPPSCRSGCTDQCLRANGQCSLTSTAVTIITVNDESPFISQTGNNAPTGLDVDLMNYIANLYGITFTYQYTQFSQLISIVQNNTNTISISSQTDTSAREEYVNFAQFFKTGSAFLVQSTYSQTLNGLSDLCGKTVVVLSTSIQEIDAQNQNGQCGVNTITIQSVSSITALVAAVQNDAATVGIYDQAPLVSIAGASNNVLKVVGDPYDIQPYGILCNKQNKALCCALVNAINYLIEQGTYEQLLQKYSFNYKNNGICPSRINLSGTTCLATCTPSDAECQVKLNSVATG